MTQRLLLCTNHLRHLAGSEIVTFELARWFASNAWGVDIHVTEFEEPMQALFKGSFNSGEIRVITEPDFPFSQDEYDVIWINHSLVPLAILAEWMSGGVRTPTIWHHMSTFEPLEMPLFPELERSCAWKITAVSQKVASRLGEFGIPHDSVTLFENPAPDEFNVAADDKASGLQSLLVVSNHPPSEILEALELLRSRGISISTLGIGGEHYKLIDPQTLRGFSAVITIGKTTQYCLSMGIPVYVYDHFGGSGWLTTSNFESEAGWQFSGRSANRRLTASQITDEVFRGFESAQRWARVNREHLAERYSLSLRLTELLRGFERWIPKEVVDQSVMNQALAVSQFRWRLVNSLNLQAGIRAEAEQRLAEAEQHLASSRGEIVALKSSSSWRITGPLRAIRRGISRVLKTK